MVDLPTTEIIEPLFFCRYGNIILVAPNVKNYNGEPLKTPVEHLERQIYL